MISKHSPMRSLQKSSIAELARYITSEQGKQERVGDITITNCHSLNTKDAVREMLAVQACNTRSTADKTYHLMVSFADGEQPSKDVLQAVERRLCEALGFKEHQRISAVHHDTDHVHIHIAINKIHPNRHTIHTPHRDYKTLGETSAALEREFNLVRVDHSGRKSVGEGRAADMEHHAGIESLMSWVRRECLPELKVAKSWDDVHSLLNRHSLSLHPRGNGFVIKTERGAVIKASSIDRSMARSKLEARFGEFDFVRGATRSEQKRGEARRRQGRYEERPIGYDSEATSLFHRYQAEQNASRSFGAAHISQARSKRVADLAALQRRVKLQRAAIRLMPAAARRVWYKLAKQSAQRERDAIHGRFQKSRQTTASHYASRTWADWLRDKADGGDEQALKALRRRDMQGRKAMQVPPRRPPISSTKKNAPPPAFRTSMDTTSAPGSVIHARRFRAGDRLVTNKTPVPAMGAKPPRGFSGRPRAVSSLRSIVQLGVAPVQIAAHARSNVKSSREIDGQLLTKDSTTKRGTIIFRAGRTAIRDDGTSFHISRGANDDGLAIALTAAARRFGGALKIDGSDAFKKHLIGVVVKNEMPITFADPAMEMDRLNLARHKGEQDVREQPGGTIERRTTDRRNTFGVGSPANGRGSGWGASVSPQRGGAGTDGRRANELKPNVAKSGSNPPPAGRNRLRSLSQLGVVHHADRGEMPLPRDVSHNMDKQGADSVHGLRRPVHRAGAVGPPDALSIYV